LETIPNAFIAPLYGFNMINPWNYCLDIGAKAVHPHHAQISLLPDYVKNCHDRGIRVHPWTANSEENIKFLLDAGVDAIITNYPDVAMDLRDGRK
jgi:glycerophosphoryl diester phosphodiesterase